MAHRNRLVPAPQTNSGQLSERVCVALQESCRRDVRADVAQTAARLIAEGLTDYHAAKQKAAKQHGITNGQGLPDNHEIEMALREHLALFCRETQPKALSALRDILIRVMRQFERFSPWLVGAVLTGTANEFSEIELELIGVEPKEFEIYLLNTGVRFTLLPTRRGKRTLLRCAQPIVKYRLEFTTASVTVALFDDHATRQAKYPRDSVNHDRAKRPEAERRFQNEHETP